MILATTLKYIAASILALAGSGASYQYVATKLDEQKYPPIGKMVDVGGYKLHMIDSGTGGPTIVMDAGLGGYSLDWSLVQPEIAKFNRIVTYDRAGYGWSDESPLARTSENIVKELHTMLHSAGVPVPYILVGHSFGGINVQLFANIYPEEVAGLLLIESSHKDQEEKLPTANLPWYLNPTIAVTASKLGIARLFMDYFDTDSFEKYSPNIRTIRNSQKLATKHINALVSEFSNFKQSLNQLKDTENCLGDKPLIVLTAGKQLTYEEGKEWYNDDCTQVDQRNKAWLEMQADLATKSSGSKQIIAQNSGHTIQYDQPEIVIEAVHGMVNEFCKVK